MTNRIAELRKERKLSQAELAEAVDVTRQTIISLESGRYNASLLLAHRIARYFDLTIEVCSCLTGTNDRTAPPGRSGNDRRVLE